MSTGQKILVMGATGEIGSRVAKGCVEMRHKVVEVSRGVNKRHRVNLDGIKFIYGDKENEEFWGTLPAEYLSVPEILSRRPEVSPQGPIFLMEHMCFNISKAVDCLGYSPEYTAEESLEIAPKGCLNEGMF